MPNVAYGGPEDALWVAGSDPLSGAERKVSGIGRGVVRRQILRQDERKLAAVIDAKPDTASPLIVPLKPWATVTGRFPRNAPERFEGAVLYGLPEYVVVDQEGRFK